MVFIFPSSARQREERNMEGQPAATEGKKTVGRERAGDGAFVPRSATPRLALPTAGGTYGITLRSVILHGFTWI